MVDPKQRSKKQSNSKKRRNAQRPLKGFTLYLCHNIDFQDVADSLRRAGVRFRRHGDYFHGETPDTELLRLVGKRRWILITADQKQRTRLVERALIARFKIREFVFTSGEIGDVGRLLVKASRQMRNLCKSNPGPFVASISQNGNVAMRSLRIP